MTHRSEFATRAASRVDEDAVGIDPLTIITIITQILPVLIGCFKSSDESNPAAVKNAVRKQNERNPKQLLRRTAHAIRRESTEKLSREQSEVLAEAVIDQILEETPVSVANAVREN